MTFLLLLPPRHHDTTTKLTTAVFLFFFIFSIIFCTTTAFADSSSSSSQHEYILEFQSNSETKLFIQHHEKDIAHVRYIYDTDILTGTAVEFKDEKVAKQIVATTDHGIVQAWPIRHHIRQHAPIINNMMDVTENDVENEATKKNTIPFTLRYNDTLSILTQANNVYKGLKYSGQGIKIGIIDSGVDYTLPALGGCFGPGCKVAYGYDLVGNNFDGSIKSIQESNDPIDNCPANSTSATGHGTFIGGLIVADDKEYNWTGVAPSAKIGMWKIYGCYDSYTPNDIVIKAMEMAYKANMDVLSISVGVLGGWEQDALSIVADRLVSKGIHVVAASGNIGTSGIFLTASPATGKNVIAAGSTMNSHVPGYLLEMFKNNTTSDDATIDIPYRTFVNSPLVINEKLPLVATSHKFNADYDACDNLTSRITTNHSNSNNDNKYNGKIVLIHQGGCDSLLKISHARAAGARAVILYTDTKNATTDSETLTTAVLPVAFVNNNDGFTLFKTAVVVQFTNIMVALKAPLTEINSVSSFSSLGPTNELQLKPELMAIGGNVFSTLPRYLNSYGFRSGTSFSAPYIAGSIALLLSNTQNKTGSPDMVKNLLMNFANQVNKPISAVHYEDSPIRQGAGVVDVVQAIQNRFHATPAKLSLNDTAHAMQQHEITIYNHHSHEVEFNIGHLPALTMTGYSLTDKKSFAPTEPVGMYARNDSAASVEFSSTKLVVPALKSAKVSVHIQPPTRVFTPETHALYGGYISITSSDNNNSSNSQMLSSAGHSQQKQKKVTIPYFGMIGNMIDLPVLDFSTNPSSAAPYTFPSIGLANGNVSSILKSNETGHLHIQNHNGTLIGGPYILVRLLTGTAMLQMQVLKGNQIIGDVPHHAQDTPRTWLMRNTLYPTEYTASFYTWNWIGDYVSKDATLLTTKNEEPRMLDSGEYRLKLRALRVFGHLHQNQDWDEWISPKLMLNITQ